MSMTDFKFHSAHRGPLHLGDVIVVFVLSYYQSYHTIYYVVLLAHCVDSASVKAVILIM